MTRSRLFLLTFTLLFMPLDSPADDGLDHPVSEYLRINPGIQVIDQLQAHDIVETADWDQARRLELVLNEYYYEPEELVLQLNQPYKMTVRNAGEVRHDIAGEEFFSSIVIASIRSRGLRMRAYHVENLNLAAGGEVEVWFVPVKQGEFPFICTISSHLTDGMEGRLVIGEP